VFGVPVMMNSDLRDGSMRAAATSMGCKILLYEAGQALRFDELSIRAGMRGIINVLAHLGMTRKKPRKKSVVPFKSNHSSWMRANASGIVHNLKHLGDRVEKSEVLAEIGDPFGDIIGTVKASKSGIIVGKQNIPLVQEGDAMFHIAYFSDDDEEIAETIETMQEDLLPQEPAVDEMQPNE
jgi:uncharacterized protein